MGSALGIDTAAFHQLHTTHKSLVRRIVRRHCVYGSVHDHGDLEQETWLRIWKVKESIQRRDNIPGYVARVARSVCIDAARSASLSITNCELKEDIVCPHWQSQPMETLETKEAVERLLGVIDTICSRVLVLRAQGFSNYEVALRLKVSIKTVQRRIILGHRKLLACLDGGV